MWKIEIHQIITGESGTLIISRLILYTELISILKIETWLNKWYVYDKVET